MVFTRRKGNLARYSSTDYLPNTEKLLFGIPFFSSPRKFRLQTWAPRKELLCGHACSCSKWPVRPHLFWRHQDQEASPRRALCLSNFLEEAPSGSSSGLPDHFCRGPRRSEAEATVWPLCSSCGARSPCALSTHTWQVWRLPASGRPAATSSVAAH